jgi:pimeloyl-ACP methyl ester carboxylesterase
VVTGTVMPFRPRGHRVQEVVQLNSKCLCAMNGTKIRSSEVMSDSWTSRGVPQMSRLKIRARIILGSHMPGILSAFGRSGFRIRALVLIALLGHSVGCARPFPVTELTPIKATAPAELQRYLLSRNPDVAQFRLRGPFAVIERKDQEIPLSSDLTVEADLYLCAEGPKAPLVIVLHGLDNSKEDHAFQAMHLASWGMHSIALDLPKRGPWIANGRILAKLVDVIHRMPQLVDAGIDAEKIILVGHSFGATAVATALGEGAPALGGVLLDPAGIGRQLPQLLKRIIVPVMVIGADEDIWPTRNRGQFYRFIPGVVGEISIRDTVHQDAQYPNEHTLRAFEDSPDDTEEAQIAFVSALTASAFGLAATGSLDYGWTSFENAIKKGIFFNARRK